MFSELEIKASRVLFLTWFYILFFSTKLGLVTSSHVAVKVINLGQ